MDKAVLRERRNALRYTLVLKPETYTIAAKNCMQKLREAGFSAHVVINNYWQDFEPYNAVRPKTHHCHLLTFSLAARRMREIGSPSAVPLHGLKSNYSVCWVQVRARANMREHDVWISIVFHTDESLALSEARLTRYQTAMGMVIRTGTFDDSAKLLLVEEQLRTDEVWSARVSTLTIPPQVSKLGRLIRRKRTQTDVPQVPIDAHNVGPIRIGNYPTTEQVSSIWLCAGLDRELGRVTALQ